MKSLAHLSKEKREQATSHIESYKQIIETKQTLAVAIQDEMRSTNGMSEKMTDLQDKLQDAMRAHNEIVSQCKKLGLRVLDNGIQFPVLPYISQQDISTTVEANLGEFGKAVPLPTHTGQIGAILVLLEEQDVDHMKEKLIALGYVDSDLVLFNEKNPAQTPLLAGI